MIEIIVIGKGVGRKLKLLMDNKELQDAMNKELQNASFKIRGVMIDCSLPVSKEIQSFLPYIDRDVRWRSSIFGNIIYPPTKGGNLGFVFKDDWKNISYIRINAQYYTPEVMEEITKLNNKHLAIMNRLTGFSRKIR